MPAIRRTTLPISAVGVTLMIAACGGQTPHHRRTVSSKHTTRTTLASQSGPCHSFKSTANGTTETIKLAPTRGISCLDAYEVVHSYVNAIDPAQLNGDSMSSSYTKVGSGWRCHSHRGAAVCTRGAVTIDAKVLFVGQDFTNTGTSTQTTSSAS